MAKIRTIRPEDVDAVVGLQKLAFPPPFSEDYHWDPEHIERHIELFPEGQWLAEVDGEVVGSCSNCIISEADWQRHASWGATVGGPMIRNHLIGGTTLYGLDITVHPVLRRQGIGRAFYETRYDFVRSRRLARYGTGCRIPGFQSYHKDHPEVDAKRYAELVAGGEVQDRTMTPLLRYGLRYLGVIPNYRPDEESANYGALLEWNP